MAELSVKELSKELRDAIANLDVSEGLEKSGIVIRVGDGVAWIYGLREAGSSEILKIETIDGGVADAFALNLMEDEIGAVLLGDENQIAAGAKDKLRFRQIKIKAAAPRAGSGQQACQGQGLFQHGRGIAGGGVKKGHARL